jgi:Tol biopolymer transport system component
MKRPETRHETTGADHITGNDAANILNGMAGADTTLNVVTLATGQSAIVKQGKAPITNPIFSLDGKRLAYQIMPREDWEVYVVNVDGTARRLGETDDLRRVDRAVCQVDVAA